MSWSIGLSGPINAVRKELAEAGRVIESAIAHLDEHTVDPKDSISVSVNGWALWDADGKVTGSSTGHYISVKAYEPPKPPVEDTVSQAEAPVENLPAER